MEQFAATYGLPGAVILILTSALVRIYFKFIAGDVVSRREVDELMRIKDEQLADKAQQVVLWRAVGETSQAQMGELLEHSRLSVQLLQGIADRAKEAGR